MRFLILSEFLVLRNISQAAGDFSNVLLYADLLDVVTKPVDVRVRACVCVRVSVHM